MAATETQRRRTPIPDGDGFKIPLSHGAFALVDAIDLELVSGRTWTRWANSSNNFYARSAIQRNRRQYGVLMHQLIMPAKDGLIVDHRDRNGLNNRRSNLRYGTRSQNRQNALGPMGKVAFKGVAPHTSGGFQAYICINRKQKYLGRFAVPEEAARAYDAAAAELFGEFALTNEALGLLPPREPAWLDPSSMFPIAEER